MANAIYWDTSALLKLYASEPDSGDYLRLLMQLWIHENHTSNRGD